MEQSADRPKDCGNASVSRGDGESGKDVDGESGNEESRESGRDVDSDKKVKKIGGMEHKGGQVDDCALSMARKRRPYSMLQKKTLHL